MNDLENIEQRYDEYHKKKSSAQPSLKIARCISRARLRGLVEYVPDLVAEIRTLRTLDRVFSEILEERQRQNKEWGGAEHDDRHKIEDWSDFIEYQLGNPTVTHSTTKEFLVDVETDEARNRFIKIAALAVAAIESIDRKSVD